MKFCEERLCAWIVEPSNAWSNSAFLVVAGYLFWRLRGGPAGHLVLIPALSLVMGIASFAFHATGTRVGEIIDDSAMYLLASMFISFALGRLRGWTTPTLLAVFGGLAVLSVLVRTQLTVLGIPFFAAQLVVFVAIEAMHFVRRSPGESFGWLWAMGATFAGSFAIWVLDATGALCDPTNHFVTGHAVWHVGTAICLGLYFEHQTRLAALRAQTPAHFPSARKD